MKNHLFTTCAPVLALACALLLGCESIPTPAPDQKPPVKQKENKPAPAPAPTPTEAFSRVAPVSNTDIQTLKEGMALYNDGDYNGAIKKLGNAPEIWNGHNKAIQVSALKYMAFSYCVTSRAQLCRQQFERALKIDPSFDLIPSEIGHPIWGPVFLKAKKVK
jgi:tetratricopeptide (TPR) repeat protein